jgi:hypothetical protein
MASFDMPLALTAFTTRAIKEVPEANSLRLSFMSLSYRKNEDKYHPLSPSA